MPKIKLTKNELKKQRDSLKRFQRYLPTLKLKQQQLQVVLRNIEKSMHDLEERLNEFRVNIQDWVHVFAEEYNITDYVQLREFRRSVVNIAGTDIPKFEEAVFHTQEYSLFNTPLWLDSGVRAIKNEISLKLELDTVQEQYNLIRRELSITIQRVNLFEKVRIPEAQEHIRTIQIYLGDQQTAAIVRGKLAKAGLA